MVYFFVLLQLQNQKKSMPSYVLNFCENLLVKLATLSSYKIGLENLSIITIITTHKIIYCILIFKIQFCTKKNRG